MADRWRRTALSLPFQSLFVKGSFCIIGSIIPRKGARKCLTRRKRQVEHPMPAPRPSMKQKQWIDEQMVAAMKAVEDGGPVRGAARKHSVPYSTLKYQVNGCVVHGTKPGPKPYLNVEEEDELGQFLKKCATVGFRKTRRDAMHIAETVVREKGNLRKEKITHGWWNRLLQQQGDLSLRREHLSVEDLLVVKDQPVPVEELSVVEHLPVEELSVVKHLPVEELLVVKHLPVEELLSMVKQSLAEGQSSVVKQLVAECSVDQ